MRLSAWLPPKHPALRISHIWRRHYRCKAKERTVSYSCPLSCCGAAEAELALAGAPLLSLLWSWLSILACSCFTKSSSSACRHGRGEQAVSKELKESCFRGWVVTGEQDHRGKLKWAHLSLCTGDGVNGKGVNILEWTLSVTKAKYKQSCCCRQTAGANEV